MQRIEGIFSKRPYDIIRHYELLQYIAERLQKSVIGAYIHSILDFAMDFENIEKDHPDLPFDIRYSIPKEVLKLFREQNAQADENLKAMQRAGSIFLRINTSLLSINEFQNRLKEHEIEYKLIQEFTCEGRTVALNCIQLFQPTQKHKEFFHECKDFFEIQDLGSQILTAMIEFQDKKVIIESCAGHGGKDDRYFGSNARIQSSNNSIRFREKTY